MKVDTLTVVVIAALLVSFEAGAQYCPVTDSPDCKTQCCGAGGPPSGGPPGPPGPPGPSPDPPPGPYDEPGPLDEGEPVNVATGVATERRNDMRISGTAGDFLFQRTFTQTPEIWQIDHSLQGTGATTYVPRPFGTSQNAHDSLYWWHNLYTYVYIETASGSPTGFRVRNGDSATYIFTPCSTDLSIPCWAVPYGAFGGGAQFRLYWTGTSSGPGYFILYRNDGYRYVYNAKWAPVGDIANHYFVGRIESPQYQASGGAAAVLVNVNYADPNLNCPGLNHPGSDSGVPYIRSATTSDGTSVLFYYKNLPSRPDMSSITSECVLDRISVTDQLTDGGSSERTVAQYTYVSDGGTPEWAGLLRAVTLPEYSPPQVRTYAYNDGAFPAFIETQSGYRSTYQVAGSPPYGNITSSIGDGRNLTFKYNGSDYQFTSCSGQVSGNATWTDSFSSAGDGVPGSSIGWTRSTEGLTASYVHSGTRIVQATDSCDAGACSGMSPGSMYWDYACNSSPGGPGFSNLRAAKDKRDNWRFYDYQRGDAGIIAAGDPDAGPGLFLIPEEREERLGAKDINGNDFLQSRKFSFAYGGVGQSPRAYEQLLDATERDSVAAPSGTPNAKARTKKVYDLTTNRLKAVIKSGWTNRFDTGTQTFVREKKYFSTFYFTTRVCSGESTADPLGRTVEVHGPCWVADESATDCPAGSPTPVTQYFFWPSTDLTNRRNRIRLMSTFPNNTGPTSCSTSTHLDTQYNQYDIRGNATQVVDANSVTTTLAYEGDSIKSVATAGLVTNFTYDNGKLTSIQYPQGNYDVFCYRTDTSGAACSGGNWTPLLQWKAKASAADGSGYSEKVAYTYWPNFEVRTETFLSSSGEVRRVREYAADAHGRPTFGQWGDGSTPVVAALGFDGANNLARVGQPYNGVPAWCLDSGTGLPSTKCSQLTYDRANRLSILDEYPQASSNPGIRTCIDHDAHGNVIQVSPGCQTSQQCAGLDGGLSSCTTASSSYQYDDFGNLVQATFPWLDDGTGAKGTIQYEYDAQGNLLTRQTPAMVANREWLAYTYDTIGRNLSATHYWWLPSPGNEGLYTLAYDSSQTISVSCSDPNLPANTQGRLLLRTDSFGQTWYQYDVFGRVTREIRLRDGTCTGSLTNNPHTAYTYTPNGNPVTVTYPLGRVVTYVYGTGANSDRPQEVDVAIYDGSSWTAAIAITGAVWEPYGGLRGYQVGSSTNAAAVEYFLGDNGASPGCPTLPPTSNDHTGRLRALRVSTGPLTLGTSAGDIYKRTYTWQGDQVSEIDTCLLSTTTPRTENYTYDQLLRLLNASGTPGVGAFVSRTYSYDSRGNRSGQSVEDCPWNLTYGSMNHPDQLTTSSSACPSAILRHDYSFDSDGRVAAKNWPPDSSGSPAYSIVLQSGPSGSGAADSVFKAAVVNGAAYNYYYDAFGRRRFKSYPLDGVNDEYFHSVRDELLTDQGVDSITLGVTGYPVDDYIWLDGRPVVVVRGRFDGTWTRLADSTANCMRNDEPAVCGLYSIVSDDLGKAVLLLDSSQKVAGALDYEPFGLVNRVALDRETPHPYPNNYSAPIADFTQSVGGPLLSLRMRVLLHMVDVEDGPGDYAKLRDGDTLQDFSISPIGGYHRGQIWTPWVQPQAGHIVIPFVSDGQNCCPDGMGGLICTPNLCPSYPNYPYQGIVAQGYEYQRYQTGAANFTIPLRFPGQYFDSETDHFENWNRYYDPPIGRYLQPEPLLEHPRRSRVTALQGRTLPAYPYALNNPLHFTDETGLAPWDPPWIPPKVPGGPFAVCEPGHEETPCELQCMEDYERNADICRKGGSLKDRQTGLGVPKYSKRACWERIAQILGDCLMECERSGK